MNLFEVSMVTAISFMFFIGGLWLAQKTPTYQEFKQNLQKRAQGRDTRKIEEEIRKIDASIKTENDCVLKKENETINALNIRKHAIAIVSPDNWAMHLFFNY